MLPLIDRLKGRPIEELKAERKQQKKTLIIGGIVCGALLATASSLQQIGIIYTTAAKAGFITALYIAFVPIISLIGGKRSPISVWISVVIAAVGFYLLCITDSFTLSYSDLLVFLCSAIFALHIVSIDLIAPKCDGVRMAIMQFFFAAIFNAIFAAVTELPLSASALLTALPSLLYLGICSSGIAYTLQIVGQRNANPTVAGIILSLESVFGVVGAAIVHGEVLSPREYLGCAVVFAAVILSQIDFSSLKHGK
jgi:drug/metabolite transporter (DMT)-like permease